MNAQNAKEYLPLVQALSEGKTIQFEMREGGWVDAKNPDFQNYLANRYRIKPEPRRFWIVEYPQEHWNGHYALHGVKQNLEQVPYLKQFEVVEIIEGQS